jgi:hypothetical protein
VIELLATLLYLAPIAAFVASRSSADRAAADVALDVPTAVAADLLVVLVLSRAMTLETAAIASRPLELAALAAWIVRRRRRGDRAAWPRALDVTRSIVGFVAALGAAAISLQLSRKYHIWDRYWHIALVPAIRGQTLPFANVYDPSVRLSYHFAGDALGAMFQAFSGARLHASHALSIAHDVMFALTGLTLGLLFPTFAPAPPADEAKVRARVRAVATSALAVALALACVLAGPTAMLRPDGKTWAGYDFVNYVTLSFRPHASIGGLFTFAFAAFAVELARRVARGDTFAERREIVVSFAIVTGGLALTDEASCMMLGVAVGVAWLVFPSTLGATRREGLVVLVGLLVALVAANLACAGLLSPGADRPSATLVPWRAPGFGNPTLPFDAHPEALGLFVGDLWALLLFAPIAAWAAARRRSPRAAAAGVMLVVLVAVGVVALGRLHIPPKAVEAHRFVTAPMLVAPFFAALWLADRAGAPPAERWPFAAAIALAVALPALSTLSWLHDPGGTPFPSNASYGREDLYAIDCREDLGARLGERPIPRYLSSSVLFLYAGCHPSFIAGKSGGHKIKTSSPQHGLEALADEDRMVGDAPLEAICPAKTREDPICQRAAQRAPCEPLATTRAGTAVVRCALTREDRATLLTKPAKPPKHTPPKPPPPPAPTDDEPDPQQ